MGLLLLGTRHWVLGLGSYRDGKKHLKEIKVMDISSKGKRMLASPLAECSKHLECLLMRGP